VESEDHSTGAMPLSSGLILFLFLTWFDFKPKTLEFEPRRCRFVPPDEEIGQISADFEKCCFSKVYNNYSFLGGAGEEIGNQFCILANG